ncbi:DUF2663 family protein [Alkalihalophilus sp. As8PL]|uniref:DUF2663 family protein n=1 Tax=Alkalihalophilus sp. As8PL TaxID=3237103 RepID=A0AB39BV16_9BACI
MMKQFKEWNINPYALTKVSLVMLEEMVTRKEKWDQYKKAKDHWSLFTLLSLGLFLLFGAQVIRSVGGAIGPNLLSILVGNVFLLLLILLFAVGLVQVKLFTKKVTKAEDEFESLRIECIDRSSELWEEDQGWKYRDDVFTYMKKNHDVNLYYK